jgi:hypothetical protein
MNINYHYLIMAQKDLLQNQVIEEILREKSSYYNAQNKSPDYWIVISPDFLDENNLKEDIRKTNFYRNQKEKIVANPTKKEPLEFYAALVSQDIEFMNWIKLRLGYFEEIGQFKTQEKVSKEKVNDTYVSDGVCGSRNSRAWVMSDSAWLASNPDFLHPDIINQKLSDSIRNFY